MKQDTEALVPSPSAPPVDMEANVPTNEGEIVVPAAVVPAAVVAAEPVSTAPPVAMEPIKTTVSHVPTGRWKDGFCECFSLGCCHQSCLMPYCCTLIGLGQALSRVNLCFTGERINKEKAKTQFYALCGITLLYLIISSMYGATQSAFLYYILGIIGFLATILVCLGRGAIRSRDKIPNACCGVAEDFCAAAFCSCCVTSQLMRHTCDYKDVQGGYFTYTGLPVEDSDV